MASAKDYNKYSRQTPKQQQQYAQFISKQEASQIALDTIWQKYQQNGYVDDVELKNKNGQSYYEVEVKVPSGMEFEVYIDAQTGNVTRMKRD